MITLEGSALNSHYHHSLLLALYALKALSAFQAANYSSPLILVYELFRDEVNRDTPDALHIVNRSKAHGSKFNCTVRIISFQCRFG